MAKIERVIALGFFDGVHLGHGALIRRVKEAAENLNVIPAVLTFDTHPNSVVSGAAVPLICNAATRADIITRLYGIESVIFIHFNAEVMRMPWQQFLKSVQSELGAVSLVAGDDFRFGYKGEGNAEKLRQFCGEYGIGCDIIPKVTIDGIEVSSTYIRELIENGEIERANEFLGHPHELVDTVRYGYKLGRKIGAPTINMRFPENVLIPKHGVYATKVYLEDGAHTAVTNIGVRPTISGNSQVSVESFILDFDGNLYGRQVRVEFYKFIRPEIKFDGIEELKEQIAQDAASTRLYFESK